MALSFLSPIFNGHIHFLPPLQDLDTKHGNSGLLDPRH